jgi:hypothetical protein
VYIQCKPKDVQSLQSSYVLVFYHFGFEPTTLTLSRIIDFDDATDFFFKQVYSCTVVDACLIWTNLLILISRPVRWDKLYQSTHFKGKLHKLPIYSIQIFIRVLETYKDALFASSMCKILLVQNIEKNAACQVKKKFQKKEQSQ